MPTANQLVRKGRKPRHKAQGTRALQGNPQVRGVVTRCYVIEPKKPNSAKRKVVRVTLVNGTQVTAFVPSRGHNLQEHSSVLIQGGRRKDLAGIKYEVVRGVLDCNDGKECPTEGGSSKTITRNNKRSLYGVRRSKTA